MQHRPGCCEHGLNGRHRSDWAIVSWKKNGDVADVVYFVGVPDGIQGVFGRAECRAAGFRLFFLDDRYGSVCSQLMMTCLSEKLPLGIKRHASQGRDLLGH
jgi:hypothetical protein